jgi:predicted  nucleic acid-binding Zn-ribbon protein
MNVTERVKATLSVMEALRKELNALDECGAELLVVRKQLDGAKGELAQTENRLEQIRRMVAEDDAAHAAWVEATIRERARVNSEIDGLQGKLAALEVLLAEKTAQQENIVAGMKALRERLGV